MSATALSTISETARRSLSTACPALPSPTIPSLSCCGMNLSEPSSVDLTDGLTRFGNLAFAIGDGIERDQPVACGVAYHPNGIFALAHFVDLRFEHLAKNQDAAIRRCQMFLAPIEHRSGGFPRHVILHPNSVHSVFTVVGHRRGRIIDRRIL